jgi:glucose/arabinose dehydrogenase
MRRILRDVLLLMCLGFLAWLLLPQRWSVNPPLGSLWGMFSGGRAAALPAGLGERLRLAEGFRIGLFAGGLNNVRALKMTPAGDLLVSQPSAGRVVLLERDANGDGQADGRRELLTGLNRPHGMDVFEGWLYVAETNAIARVRFNPEQRRVSGEIERVVTNLPGGGNHWVRSVRFGPDGWMYVSVGSSCNVCEERDPRRAALLRFRPDGSAGEIYAGGLRNTTAYAWQPGSGALYGGDIGRDFLGDDLPPEEFNLIERGKFYGWPYANGDRVADPDFGAANPARVADSVGPRHTFPAHSTPLGLIFLAGERLPADYRGAALVALHGSWNRSKKIGYEVVSLHFGAAGIVERKFLTGFLRDENVVGRPVDLAEGPDGAIYLSDDYAGSVYRITHGG